MVTQDIVTVQLVPECPECYLTIMAEAYSYTEKNRNYNRKH